VSPLAPLKSGLFRAFHCGGCGGHEAYRSRPRGVLEKLILPLLMLQPARCVRCYHRGYVFKSVAVLDRAPSAAPQSSGQPSGDSSAETRVA
jgi:hypothetical protein